MDMNYWLGIRHVRNDVIRLEARVAALEAMIFQIDPKVVREQMDSLEAVRSFLLKVKIDDIAPHVCTFLSERLPVDWMELVRRHGHYAVFNEIARYQTIQGARKALDTRVRHA